VALMRRGMDEVMRMACELGVDHLQPLQAQRSVPQAECRPDRWGVILREAVEQCERLWAPELLPVLSSDDWWNGPSGQSLRLIAVTRDQASTDLSTLLAAHRAGAGCCWIAIGPEGGWTSDELRSAAEAGWCGVGLGDTILRSSTAAVAAATALCSWRRAVQRS
jgi:16S rRNA (uracil1498-N3)-methyltransferase